MFHLIERLIGRDLLWRLSRRAYHHVRREGSLDHLTNGEAWLQDRFAHHSAAQGKPLTIVDVGANYGQWSSTMVEALKRNAAPKASMTLFEPVPPIRALLTETMAKQQAADVRIEPLALSGKSGRMTMTVNEIGSGTHHLGEIEGDEQGETLSVEVNTLDAYWSARGGGPIDLVKIDAEGYDGNVALGMRELLARGDVDVIQFEYGVLFMRTRMYLRDMIDLAHAHGYRFASLYHGGIEVIDQWHPDIESFVASEKLILHPRAVDWLGAREVRYTPSNTLRYASY